jgi:hypothetical protein
MISSCSPSWAKCAADEIKYTFSHSMSEGLVVGPQAQLFVAAGVHYTTYKTEMKAQGITIC